MKPKIDKSAKAQYKCLLKAYQTTRDLQCIFDICHSCACEKMRELQDYVISLGKRPVNRMISTSVFLEYYNLDIEDFRQRALAEESLLKAE